MIKSLRWRVAVAYVALLVAAIIVLSLFIINYLRSNYQESLRQQLLAEARMIASQAQPLVTPTLQTAALVDLVRQDARLINGRVSFILPDGTVVAESELDPSQMENHLTRPEVQQALNGNDGWQIRFSETLQRDLFYIAIPIKTDSQITGIIRLAVPLIELENALQAISNSVLMTAVGVILASIVLAVLLTNYTTKPLQRLTQNVLRLGGKEAQSRSVSANLDEVSQLEHAFSQLSGQIDEQINELTQERGTLSAVLAYMNDGILIVDTEGKVQLVNPAALTLFGLSTEQAMGKSLIEVVRHYQIVELWRKSQQTNEQQITTLETTPDRMFMQCIATPLPQVVPGSTLLVLQDLTRLRRLELVRRDFVSNVSHELRTPLASLKALTETLAEGALEDPPAARRFLVRMEHEIDNLTQMVQELLELSRIESGKVPLKKLVIPPHALINSAVERMQLQAQRAGLSLLSECPTDLPSVLADATRIEQVLINLLHNAIKFTPPGGSINVTAYQNLDAITFEVRDTGVGITSEALPRIFERFYKADRSRSGGGTGLGLSIARHTIEAHGGRIWAESTVNAGSTFYFSIRTS